MNAACFVLHGPPVDVCTSTVQGGAPPPFFCYAYVPSFIQADRIVCDLQAELF